MADRCVVLAPAHQSNLVAVCLGLALTGRPLQRVDRGAAGGRVDLALDDPLGYVGDGVSVSVALILARGRVVLPKRLVVLQPPHDGAIGGHLIVTANLGEAVTAHDADADFLGSRVVEEAGASHSASYVHKDCGSVHHGACFVASIPAVSDQPVRVSESCCRN